MMLKEKSMLAKAYNCLVVLFTLGIAFVSGCKAANASLSSNSSNTEKVKVAQPEVSAGASAMIGRRSPSMRWVTSAACFTRVLATHGAKTYLLFCMAEAVRLHIFAAGDA